MKTKTEKKLENAGSFATLEANLIKNSFGGFDAHARATRNFGRFRFGMAILVITALSLFLWKRLCGVATGEVAIAVAVLTALVSGTAWLAWKLSFSCLSRISAETSLARSVLRRARRFVLTDCPVNLEESIQDGPNPLYPLGDVLAEIGESASAEISDIETSRPREIARREALKKLIRDLIRVGTTVEKAVYDTLSQKPLGTWKSPWKWPGAKLPATYNTPIPVTTAGVPSRKPA